MEAELSLEEIENLNRDPNVVKIGARYLIETLYKTGSINQIAYSGLSAREGTRTHQVFSNKLREEYRSYEVYSEFTLNYRGFYNGVNLSAEFDPSYNQDNTPLDGLEVNGRADLLLIPVQDENTYTFNDFDDELETPFIMEVKTVNRPLDGIPHDGEAIHWNQAKIYTFMYWNEKLLKGEEIPAEIPFALAYVSVETLECKFLFDYIDWNDLNQWFMETAYSYLNLAVNIQKRLDMRDASIASMTFPYDNMRDGQSTLMEQAYNSIGRITPLLAQAPTGIGKTIATLYPAIQQLASGNFSHIFYLTAKTSTRVVAEAALNDLRKKSALNIRSITLTAKEKICPYHKDSADCPYSINYYDNLPDALEELWPVQELNADIIIQASEKHKVCAFELSLDLAVHCDVIIGDYNHAFDPRVRLDRFFGRGAGSQILLVDEAHNLVDRSREMYSATLDSASFNYALTLIPSENMRIYTDTQDIMKYFNRIDSAIKMDEDGFDDLEKSVDDFPIRVVKTEDFRATTAPLKNLANMLIPWVQEARKLLDMLNNPKQERFLIKLISEAKFFTRVIDEFWSDAYISAARNTKQGLFIKIICLDVSKQLAETYVNEHAAVFFSATLRPMEYFIANFCGTERDNRPDTLDLSSPFPPENLQVYVSSYVQTTYKMRQQTANALAKTLALTILLKRGQQFIYFPSFAYMDMISPMLKKILNSQDVIWLEQKRQMNTKERQDFLEAFAKPKPGKTLIGLVVLGGIFGEGIDLVGDSLTGISIVSVGLPQLSPERNIMSEYYDYTYQQGFNFAYLYPAINKILQASGRLIRSEEDSGFIQLIDERYAGPNYRLLLPEEWNIQEVKSIAELKEVLSEDNNI